MTSTPPPPGLRPEVVEPLEALLCDADGDVFPSEEPASTASADVLAVVDSWAELADMLLPHLPPRAGADRLVPTGGAR
jgi:hypothetical protein